MEQATATADMPVLPLAAGLLCRPVSSSNLDPACGAYGRTLAERISLGSSPGAILYYSPSKT